MHELFGHLYIFFRARGYVLGITVTIVWLTDWGGTNRAGSGAPAVIQGDLMRAQAGGNPEGVRRGQVPLSNLKVEPTGLGMRASPHWVITFSIS